MPAGHQTLLVLLKSAAKDVTRKTVTHHASHEDHGMVAQAHSVAYARLQARLDPQAAFERVKEMLLSPRPADAAGGRLRQRWRHAVATLRDTYHGALGSTPGAPAGAPASASPHTAAEPHAAGSSGRDPAAAPSTSATAASATATAPATFEALFESSALLRSAVLYTIASASHAFMTVANSTTVSGGHHLEAALRRPPGTPLLTVSNHVAAMDDPLVVSTLVPPAYFSQPQALRWTLCASDRCFSNAALAPFFRAAKVLPVERGGGMAQAGMQAAESRLAAGDWVHIFPEGTRRQDGKMGPVRKGVGRLVAACAEAGAPAPLVVPFVHSGMADVMPRGKKVPSVGQEVRVLVGEPVDVSDLLAARAAARSGAGADAAAAAAAADDALYRAIAHRVGGALAALQARLEGREDAELPYGRGAQGDESGVSGLDLFDPSDVPPGAPRGSAWERWERLRFRASHRAWATMHSAQEAAQATAQAAALSAQAAAARAQSRLAARRQRLRERAAGWAERLRAAQEEGLMLDAFTAGDAGVGWGRAAARGGAGAGGGQWREAMKEFAALRHGAVQRLFPA